MGTLQLLSAIGFPLMMAIGGIAAWRMSRKENDPRGGSQEAWRDDSLDEWRRERESLAEQARAARDLSTADQHASRRQEEASEVTRHQRIGG